MFIPNNTEPFYYPTANKNILYQGDIIEGRRTGLEDLTDETYPDYWMIITKSCDLILSETLTTSKENISIVPLFTLKYLKEICKEKLSYTMSTLRRKIVLMAVWRISEKFGFGKLKDSEIGNIIKDRVSKFMYLPPDGNVFSEPMIIDFDLINPLDGSNQEGVRGVLNAKVLQLATPFREKVAQRFAYHYSNIGIDDKEIRDKPYVKALIKHLKQE